MTRLLLDTNIFKPENQSKINALLARYPGAVILGNTVALDELLYIRPTVNSPGVFSHTDSLKMFVDLTQGRWFRSFTQVGHESALLDKEMSTRKKYKYWFLSCAEEALFRKKINDFIRNPRWALSVQERERTAQSDTLFKGTLNTLFRQSFQRNGRGYSWLRTLKQERQTSFDQFYNTSFVLHEGLIPRIFRESSLQSPPALYQLGVYAYLDLLFKGYMFVFWDAIGLNGSHKLDSHCRKDMWQVCCMRDADILVTNENGFLRRCFDAVWGHDSSKTCVDL
jgi:hypothetical protein